MEPDRLAELHLCNGPYSCFHLKMRFARRNDKILNNFCATIRLGFGIKFHHRFNAKDLATKLNCYIWSVNIITEIGICCHGYQSTMETKNTI